MVHLVTPSSPSPLSSRDRLAEGALREARVLVLYFRLDYFDYFQTAFKLYIRGELITRTFFCRL